MADYAELHAPSLESRPTLKALFIDLAQQLVEGFALDTEALVDILTLKGNTSPTSRDAVIALEKLYRDTVCRSAVPPFLSPLLICQTLPAGRRQVVLLSIWRRVYIRDE